MIALIFHLPRVYPQVIYRCIFVRNSCHNGYSCMVYPQCVFQYLPRVSFYKDGLIGDLCNVYNLVVFFLLGDNYKYGGIQSPHSVFLSVASVCLASSPFQGVPYQENCIRRFITSVHYHVPIKTIFKRNFSHICIH